MSIVTLIDDDRVIHELDMERLKCKDGTLTTSVGSDLRHQRHCQRDTRVSSNGLRVVICHTQCSVPTETSAYDYGEEQWHSTVFVQMELMFVELCGNADQMRRVELEYPDPFPSTTHEHVINLSPDLSILQADLHIFDLLTPGYPRFSFPDSPFSNIRDMVESSVSFSACNGYLNVIKSANSEAKGKKVTLELFRIFRSARRIERIVLADLEGLVADRIFTAFHPEMPLLMATFIGKKSLKKVVEIDLLALNLVPVELQLHSKLLADE